MKFESGDIFWQKLNFKSIEILIIQRFNLKTRNNYLVEKINLFKIIKTIVQGIKWKNNQPPESFSVNDMR